MPDNSISVSDARRSGVRPLVADLSQDLDTRRLAEHGRALPGDLARGIEDDRVIATLADLAAKAGGEPVGFVPGAVASTINGAATNAIKRSSARQRPDGSSPTSFPSGHASSAASYFSSARWKSRVARRPADGWFASAASALPQSLNTPWSSVASGQ